MNELQHEICAIKHLIDKSNSILYMSDHIEELFKELSKDYCCYIIHEELRSFLLICKIPNTCMLKAENISHKIELIMKRINSANKEGKLFCTISIILWHSIITEEIISCFKRLGYKITRSNDGIITINWEN